MIIHYYYFGVPIPSLTHEKQAVEIPSGTTIDQLMKVIGETIEDSASEFLNKASFLVNKMGAKREAVLKDGDEVVILYPIGGG
ncbi:MoaD/ThiS family protein [Neobacillus dielmonensis]|uniref:MoaD/ThiS family protein n=1 Tax=Neobacillus dielmonensis TaxID=1347369 RepID=UPI0005AA5094|nr:MoaD/ThiS family protein [Neobacillus dielmonensis]